MVILCINVVLGMIYYWVYHITLLWTYIRCWFDRFFFRVRATWPNSFVPSNRDVSLLFPPKKRRSIPRSTKNLYPLGELGELWRPSSRLEDFWATLAGTDDCITLQARSGDLVEAPLGTWLAALQLFQYVLQIMYQLFKWAVYCACEVSLVVSPHFFQFFFNTCNLNLASPRQSLLVSSVDSNSSDEHFLTPLHVACAEGNFDTWMVGCFQFLGRWNHETTNGFWHVVLVGWFQFLAFRIELDNPSRYRKSIGYWHMIHPSMYEYKYIYIYPIGSMYAIYGNIYHQYTPNVSIYTIHGSYGYIIIFQKLLSNPPAIGTPQTVSLLHINSRVDSLELARLPGWIPW